MRAGSSNEAMDSNSFPVIHLNAAEKNMIAGGIAGCIGKTVTAPLSRLTVLSQVSSLFAKEGGAHFTIGHKENIFGTMKRIIKHQGVLSLWNGNLTSVLHRFPYSAINFAVFEASNNQLTKLTGRKDTTTNRFLAGASSGAAACFACYPLDLIRTRLTVANSFSPPGEQSMPQGGKIYRLVREIVVKEGISGLYRGLPVSLLVTAPNLAISFSIYGFAKDKLIRFGGVFAYSKDEHSRETKLLHQQNAQLLTPLGSLCSGCVSGIVSSCVMFPVDVVRKRMQVMGQLMPIQTNPATTGPHASATSNSNQHIASSTRNEHRLHNNSTSWQQAKHIVRTDGIRGFYRGLAPELMKVCPMVALMYCSYEIVQDKLNEAFPSP